MSAHPASNLDTEKFRKVHRLMTGGATDGERSAARARAEAMASKAGMTLKDAVSSLDAAAKPEPRVFDFGKSFEDSMEAKYPGWKDEEIRKQAVRGVREAVRRAEVLAAYGSETQLFAKTKLEALLGEAIRSLVNKWHHWTDEDGFECKRAEVIDGHSSEFSGWYLSDVTPAIREAVTGAYPWPSNLDGALSEVKAWDRLRWDRGLFRGEWDHYPEVDCRIALLEKALMSGQPAASWADLQARFEWKRYEFERQWIDPTKREDPFMDRIEADFAILRAKAAAASLAPEPATPAGPRTTAEKRAAVMSMLDTHPELSDREIARRIGVSPQTVNTWRKRR